MLLHQVVSGMLFLMKLRIEHTRRIISSGELLRQIIKIDLRSTDMWYQRLKDVRDKQMKEHTSYVCYS